MKRRGARLRTTKAVGRAPIRRVAITPWHPRRWREGQGDGGFTLVELIIVVAILPIVVGAIAVALISVFGLQNTVTTRIGDSNDALVSSADFNRDVQSAQQIETLLTPACGSTTGGAQQLVGLQWGLDPNGDGTYETIVSYVEVPSGSNNLLERWVCNGGASAKPTVTSVLGHNVGSPTIALNPTGFRTNTDAGWTSTQGLYGVTISVYAPSPKNAGTEFHYTLTGLPSASSSNGSPPSSGQPSQDASCSLANPGSGAYATQLCFADFSSYASVFKTPPNTCQKMVFQIADSPDFLSFCLLISPSSQTVLPEQIPTYDIPNQGSGSEPYLGNNGFYQGIQGEPAISQRPQPTGCTPPGCSIFNGVNGAQTTLTFSNIQVTNASNQPATGWTLVTGDAESTDTNGWLMFQNASVPWSILPNSTSSLYGNSCYNDANPPSNSGLLAFGNPNGVGTPQNGPPAGSTVINVPTTPPFTTYATGDENILCEADEQLDHTGALMLAAPESGVGQQNVTITLKGEGYQAIFIGILQ